MAIFRRVVLLLHLLLAPCLVHCAGEPTPKRPEPHARRPSREPRLPASAPPPAPSAPAAPAAEEPASAGAAASSRFVPQVRLEAGITGLHVAGRQLLVAQGTKLALWTNGELDVADEHSKNLPEPGRVQAIVGDWPNVRALAWWAGADSMWGVALRHTRRGWVRERQLDQHVVFRSVSVRGSRAVALFGAPTLLYPAPAPPGLLRLTRHGLAFGPKLSRAPPPCHVKLAPRDVVLGERGRIFVFGRGCAPAARNPKSELELGSTPMVEWFERGKSRGTVVTLPPSGSDAEAYYDPVVLEEGPDGIVFAFPRTERRLRFDGKTFEQDEGVGPALWQVARADDGVRWAVARDQSVLRGPPGESWEKLRLSPSPAPCDQLDCSAKLAVVGNDVYVALHDTLYQLDGPKREPVPTR